MLRRLAEAGIAPNALALLPDHRELVDRLVDRFGSLARAREAAGLRRDRPPETGDSISRALQHLYRHGVRLSPKQLRLLGEEMLLKACYEHFGSWEKARATAVGVATPDRSRSSMPTRAELTAALRAAADGRVVVIRHLPRRIVRAAERHYGSAGAALEALGLRKGVANERWNPELVVAALVERVRDGRSITLGGLRADGRHDLANAVNRHLGGARPARMAVARALHLRRDAQKRVDAARLSLLRSRVTTLVDGFVTDAIKIALDVVPAEVAGGLAIGSVSTTVSVAEPPVQPPLPAPFVDAFVLRDRALAVAKRFKLPTKVAELLLHAVAGVARRNLAASLGRGENTVKTQVQYLLTATGHKDVDAVVAWVRDGNAHDDNAGQSDSAAREARRR